MAVALLAYVPRVKGSGEIFLLAPRAKP